MSEIIQVIDKLLKFRDDREWKQFHNAKDLAVAISVEASELLELFLWKESKDVSIEKISDELADVLSYCFLLAEKFDLSIPAIIEKKINANETRYPVNKAKGNSKKYTDL